MHLNTAILKRALFVFFVAGILSGCAQNKGKKHDDLSGNDYLVTIKTEFGDMKAILYDETQKHKANFIKLAKEGFYDSLLFHRVIKNFMIQGGDPDSKHAAADAPLGNGGPGYDIDAEIKPDLYHMKGAIAAARESDEVNPTRASSGSQFYIVQGKTFTSDQLDQLEKNMNLADKYKLLPQVLDDPRCADIRGQVIQHQNDQDTQWLNSFFANADTIIKRIQPDYQPVKFNDEQRTLYTTVGGVPHLDGNYTVFGKVISGLDVIDKIAAVQTGPRDRPAKDVRMYVSAEEMPKKKIVKLYGDVYNQ